MRLLRLPLPRLPVKHLYRAFPELDTYSDEQCQRFMRASRGGFARTIVHAAIILAITIAGFIGGSLFLIWFISSTTQNVPIMNLGRPAPLWQAILYTILIIATVALGPILGFLARDFLVIDRIRWILRSRGLCPTCRYSLVGLAVDAESRVLCPECGNTTAVDPSLSELTTDEGGRPRYKPEIPHHIKAPILLRVPLGLKRWIKRAAWGLAALMGLVILAGIGYEVFLQVQAAAARRARPSPEAWLALLESGQPDGTTPDDPDGFAIAERIAERMKEAESAARLEYRVADPDGTYNFADYQLIFLTPSQYAQWYSSNTDTSSVRAYTLESLRRLEAESIAPLIDELIRSRRAMDTPPPPGPRVPIAGEWYSRSASLNNVANMLAARAVIAAERADQAAFVQSLEGILACARIAALSPRTYGLYWSLHYHTLANTRVFDAIRRGLPAEWIQPTLDCYTRQASRPPDDFIVTGERMILEDAAAWLFEDAGAIRLGPLSDKIMGLRSQLAAWGAIARPIGTFRSNTREARERAAQIRAHFDIPDPRAVSGMRAMPGPTHLAISLFNSYYEQVVPARHLVSLTTGAALVSLHIERYRADHGVYPDSLDALVPAYLESLPIDPWDDAPIRYRRLAPGEDAFGRPFLLYSVGADRTDDNGVSSLPPRQRDRVMFAPIPADLVGNDFILNDLERFR